MTPTFSAQSDASAAGRGDAAIWRHVDTRNVSVAFHHPLPLPPANQARDRLDIFRGDERLVGDDGRPVASRQQ